MPMISAGPVWDRGFKASTTRRPYAYCGLTARCSLSAVSISRLAVRQTARQASSSRLRKRTQPRKLSLSACPQGHWISTRRPLSAHSWSEPVAPTTLATQALLPSKFPRESSRLRPGGAAWFLVHATSLWGDSAFRCTRIIARDAARHVASYSPFAFSRAQRRSRMESRSFCVAHRHTFGRAALPVASLPEGALLHPARGPCPGRGLALAEARVSCQAAALASARLSLSRELP